MKILIISSIFPPNIFGGAEVAAHSLACLLVRRGHSVSVATLKEQDESEIWGEMQPEGYRLYRVPSPRGYTLFARNKQKNPLKKLWWHFLDLFDPRNKTLMCKIIEAEQPDCVDVHNIIGFGFNVLKVIAKKGVPIKYFLHDFSLTCFHASMFCKGKNCTRQCTKCSVVGHFRQKALTGINKLGFIAPSPVPYNKMNALVPMLSSNQTEVLKNAPERVDFQKRPIEDKTVIVRLVYVGRLDPVKGIDFLLEVLDPLSVKYSFVLDILGSGPLEAELKARYGNLPWCKFHGFVSSSMVSSYISSADIFCMPSQWAEVYGLGTALALQFGVPVVGSNIGGTSTLVRDEITGILLEPNDKSAWLEAFDNLLADSSILTRLREGAKLYQSEFSDESIADKYEQLSMSLCAL